MKQLIGFFCVLFLVGCNAADEVELEKGWCGSKSYLRSYTSFEDSMKVDLCLRFSVDKSYRYENFIFVLEASSPDKLRFADTLSFVLDDQIRPTVTGEYINEKILISDMSLKRGMYHFRVKQLMCDTLFGVRQCNLIVVPN